MARPASIEEEELIARLSSVFRDVGYEGASLAMLSEATGLQRASLYHRFPGGKQQMATEVLTSAIEWTRINVVGPLTREGDLSKRLAEARANLREIYDSGSKSCLLNMLMAPRNLGGPFAPAIKTAFGALIDAFAHFAREAGHRDGAARKAGRRALTLIQGSLVLSRGLQDPRPFREALNALEAELFPQRGEA
ncbi:MAG: TetR family transcriptional regulator [Hyphomonadaceae bacterium]|nr:MAG: transcriptional regulator [Caulobacteraceae bacterium]MBT9444544.1 TetR family transcriptional regulator [Hyphomonadaceae bacterium]TPW06645.1 MAG: transcriptional regulator [Alphaproteobacteria bacterium]